MRVSTFWVLLCSSKYKKFQGHRAYAEHRSFVEQGINQSVCVDFLQNTDTYYCRLFWPSDTKHPFLEKPSAPQDKRFFSILKLLSSVQLSFWGSLFPGQLLNQDQVWLLSPALGCPFPPCSLSSPEWSLPRLFITLGIIPSPRLHSFKGNTGLQTILV